MIEKKIKLSLIVDNNAYVSRKPKGSNEKLKLVSSVKRQSVK